jgi:putative Mn2+ efflux pump MntP
MTNIEIWLLAISLAMDCFTVSITSGIIIRKICWRTCLVMSFFFGLFQALMPLIGWFSASRFYKLIEDFDHWIAFGVLTILGIRMIKEGFSDDDKCCFDPHKLKVILTMAVATSIDALAVGVSFAFLEMSIWMPIIIIGLTTMMFSVVGVLLGKKVGEHFKSKAEFVGGLVLICIGCKILIEHVME